MSKVLLSPPPSFLLRGCARLLLCGAAFTGGRSCSAYERSTWLFATLRFETGMESKSVFCFLDIGRLTTTVTTSLSADTQRWQLPTPPRVATALTNVAALLLSDDGFAVAAFLSSVSRFTPFTAAQHVVLLTRTHDASGSFYDYVLRWLQSACPVTTLVSTMPAALYAAQLAGADTALVVEAREGVVSCTPVLEGVVATDAAAVWGSVCEPSAIVGASAVSGSWRAYATSLAHLVKTVADAGDGAERPLGRVEGAHLDTSERAAATVLGDLPFACEALQHLHLCRQRELHPCLQLIVLYGDVADTADARYGMGLLLSFLLPDSLVTWN